MRWSYGTRIILDSIDSVSRRPGDTVIFITIDEIDLLTHVYHEI